MRKPWVRRWSCELLMLAASCLVGLAVVVLGIQCDRVAGGAYPDRFPHVEDKR